MASFDPSFNEEKVPLATLLDVVKTGDGEFMSTKGAIVTVPTKYKGQVIPGSLGGHVYGQAAFVAAQTVPAGFQIHSATGSWLAPQRPDYPLRYRIRILQDGKNYCSRNVEVTQEGIDGLCFFGTCSFKKTQQSVVDYQEQFNAQEKYAVVLEGKRPQDFPMTDLEYTRFATAPFRCTSTLPGFRLCNVPMKRYNAALAPKDRRHITFYTFLGPIPSFADDPGLHIAGHFYICDRESTITPIALVGELKRMRVAASLSASFVVHTGSEALSGCDENGRERWFCQECWTDRVGDGRAVHKTRVYDEKGVHIISSSQDAMVLLGDASESSPYAKAWRERL